MGKAWEWALGLTLYFGVIAVVSVPLGLAIRHRADEVAAEKAVTKKCKCKGA